MRTAIDFREGKGGGQSSYRIQVWKKKKKCIDSLRRNLVDTGQSVQEEGTFFFFKLYFSFFGCWFFSPYLNVTFFLLPNVKEEDKSLLKFFRAVLRREGGDFSRKKRDTWTVTGHKKKKKGSAFRRCTCSASFHLWLPSLYYVQHLFWGEGGGIVQNLNRCKVMERQSVYNI